jgi:hypothetical protein
MKLLLREIAVMSKQRCHILYTCECKLRELQNRLDLYILSIFSVDFVLQKIASQEIILF